MATALENLQTRYSNICTELAALDSTKAGGKPDAPASGVGHVSYKDGLYRELEFLTAKISDMGGDVPGNTGPWEEVVEGYV